MATISLIASFLVANGPAIISGLNLVLGGLIIIFLLIPGPHPEDWFQSIKDFLEKYSKK